MPRALTGRIEPRVLADGRRAFYAKIRDDRYALGHEPDWSKERAERFLTATLLPAAKLKQPWWELIPVQGRGGPAGRGDILAGL